MTIDHITQRVMQANKMENESTKGDVKRSSMLACRFFCMLIAMHNRKISVYF